jgi:hypothetical protein
MSGNSSIWGVLVACLGFLFAEISEAQTFSFGVEIDGVDCGGRIEGVPGGMVRLVGWQTLTTSDAGVSGYGSSLEVRSEPPDVFCLGVDLIESLSLLDRQEFFDSQNGGFNIFALHPDPVHFVVQNESSI